MANWLTNANSEGVTTTDSAGLTLSTELDLRVKLLMPIYPSDRTTFLLYQWDNSGNGYRAFNFVVYNGGYLRLQLSTDGSAALTYTSTSADGVAAGTTHWVRVTWKNDTGNVIFYTSLDGSAWTQLGTTVSGSTGTLYDSTGLIGICRDREGGSTSIAAIYQMEMRSAIGGSVIASANFESMAQGTRSFNDSQGNAWTLQRLAAVLVPPAGGGASQLVGGGLVKAL